MGLTRAIAICSTVLTAASSYAMEVRFPVLSSCGDEAFMNAFRGRKSLWNADFGRLSMVGMNAFSGAFTGCSGLERVNFGSLPSASGVFNEWTFYGCTNMNYVSFDRLKSGTVNLQSSNAPLVVSASNVAASVVIDVSGCTNLREVRFDTVSNVVAYDSRWIPQNQDFKMHVPARLYYAWKAAAGWSNYATNIFAEVPEVSGLCFTAEEAGATVAMEDNGGYGRLNDIVLEYTVDGQTWLPFVSNYVAHTVTLANVGEKVWIRAGRDNGAFGYWEGRCWRFVLPKKVAASGSLAYLRSKIGAHNPLPEHCYSHLFSDCVGLTKPPEFYDVHVDSYCYASMFDGCTSIKVSETSGGIYTTPFKIKAIFDPYKQIESPTDWMFYGTGGTFKGTPSVNTTYYGAW